MIYKSTHYRLIRSFVNADNTFAGNTTFLQTLNKESNES